MTWNHLWNLGARQWRSRNERSNPCSEGVHREWRKCFIQETISTKCDLCEKRSTRCGGACTREGRPSSRGSRVASSPCCSPNRYCIHMAWELVVPDRWVGWEENDNEYRNANVNVTWGKNKTSHSSRRCWIVIWQIKALSANWCGS